MERQNTCDVGQHIGRHSLVYQDQDDLVLYVSHDEAGPREYVATRIQLKELVRKEGLCSILSFLMGAVEDCEAVCEPKTADSVNDALTAMHRAAYTIINEMHRRGTENALPLARTILRPDPEKVRLAEDQLAW